MYSRRKFLQYSAMTSAAALAPQAMAAQNNESPNQTQGSEAQGGQAQNTQAQGGQAQGGEAAGAANPAVLPPAIAALTSWADKVTPISNDERRARIERARELMRQSKLDAVAISPGTSLDYFTGMHWGGGERLFCFVLPAKGKPFFVAPGFEHDRALEQIAQGPFAGDAEVFVWQEEESPYALVAKELRARGIATGALGVEETMKFVFADGIAHAAPQLQVESATPVTVGCRMIKSAHELALMRLANNATWTAYKAVYESIHAGMTDHEVSHLVTAAHARLGFEGDAFVAVGEYSALPHGSIQPQSIREGTIILIDGGCKVEGYESDMTRTFVLGKPTQKMNEVCEIVYRAQSAALAAAKPGVQAGAVDAAARKVITEAGYGPDYKYFSHRVGHGIGMDGHEWPYLVRGNQLRLQPHMTFSDEPGIYIRGEFGVRIEDIMTITEQGAELFTPREHSLERPFATS